MNPDTRKKIFLGVLLAVAAGVVVYQLSGSPGGTATPASKSAQNKAATSKAAPKAAPRTRAAAARAAEEEAEENVVVDIDALIREIEPVNFDYQTQHVARDPTTPLVGVLPQQSGEGASLAMRPKMIDVTNKKVTGIIYDPDYATAVVDDDVVVKGFVYPDGTVVQDIERDRVVFRIGDSLIPVELKQLGVRY